MGGPFTTLAATLLVGFMLGGTGAWKVQGWRADAERLKVQQAAAEQAARNRELQRAAEMRYTVAAEARERVIVETIVEVRRESQSLATCPVPEPARRLFNRAAKCAADPAAPGCADLPVRSSP
jgi:hypothetical protein